MGAKRGSYRGYNKERYANNYKSIGDHKRIAMQEDTYLSKKFAGKDMYTKVKRGIAEHFIGEVVKVHRQIQSNEKEKSVDGLVVGIYPHFLLLDCGNYKTTITYADYEMNKMRGVYG